MSLLLVTIIPSLLILAFFVFSDKFKEPKQSIIKVFVYGILITIPAYFLNTAFGDYFYYRTQVSEHLIGSFLTAAPLEEGLKFLVLYFLVYKMKDFNEPIDGVVYGVCVSLGFATLENFYYVYAIDWGSDTTPLSIAYIRAFSAVPMHALSGCAMGYFFMKYSFVSKKDNLFFCFFVPFLIHGFYNLFASVNTVALYALLVIGWIIALKLFSRLKKMQRTKRREYEKKI
tara:strand:- start:2 stop:688 length:687 start_codon:yes stop_codon:yes gene_type:complete